MSNLIKYLEELELFTPKDIEEIKKLKTENEIIDFILKNKLIEKDSLRKIIANFYKLKEVRLQDITIPSSFIKLIPEETIKNKGVLIFEITKNYAKIACSDPLNFKLINWLSIILNKKIKLYYAFKDEILSVLEKNISSTAIDFEYQMRKLIEYGLKSKKPEELPIIKILDLIIDYAVSNRASDVHIEPRKENVFVRFRIDGILHNIISLPKELNDLIISRIKIISGLRTDEHQKPQDGKFQKLVENEYFDVRVSIVPTTKGEKAALRILKSYTKELSLKFLGLSEKDRKKIESAIEKSHGMVLSTGPTGSGKTTTLYTILKILNTPELNISTIEDPVEYEIEGVNQIQVNEKAGLTFASGLRAIVRQDPDIIMVGEIRDEDTASIAINSALTGHLVLSTLHTNDAATAFPRLIDLKVKPFLVASSVNVVIGQRLARRICQKCIHTKEFFKSKYKGSLPDETLKEIFSENEKKILYTGKGCKECNFTGYKGRIGIFEVLEVSDEIKKLIIKKASAKEIQNQAVKEGMSLMLQDGVKKILKGLTTIEELIRVVS